jgi:hypothetical protein
VQQLPFRRRKRGRMKWRAPMRGEQAGVGIDSYARSSIQRWSESGRRFNWRMRRRLQPVCAILLQKSFCTDDQKFSAL